MNLNKYPKNQMGKALAYFVAPSTLTGLNLTDTMKYELNVAKM